MCRVLHTRGTAKDVAKFKETASQLTRHVGTSPWPQSSVAALKVMSTLQIPVFKTSVVLTRKYWEDDACTVKTNNKIRTDVNNQVVENTPVMED